VRPITDNDFSEFELHSMIQSIAHYQRSMALNGFFVRGGLTIGSIYLDENIIFGKALLDTYEYESKIACTPRIIIDENVKIEIKKYIEKEDYKEDTPQNKYTLISDDNYEFIDYLTITHQIWNKILSHKEEIEKKLKDFTSESKIFSKYCWLANYHNFFCDENKDMIDNIERYKIQDHNLKIKFRRNY